MIKIYSSRPFLKNKNKNPDLFGPGKYLMYFLVMVFCQKLKIGIGKVNKQGYKHEPEKYQDIFPWNVE